jgi:hypothetical protein
MLSNKPPTARSATSLNCCACGALSRAVNAVFSVRVGGGERGFPFRRPCGLRRGRGELRPDAIGAPDLAASSSHQREPEVDDARVFAGSGADDVAGASRASPPERAEH